MISQFSSTMSFTVFHCWRLFPGQIIFYKILSAHVMLNKVFCYKIRNTCTFSAVYEDNKSMKYCVQYNSKCMLNTDDLREKDRLTSVFRKVHFQNLTPHTTISVISTIFVVMKVLSLVWLILIMKCGT